jgi:ATP-dependent DNA helicase RecG
VHRLSHEGQLLDTKSLRSVIGKSADWNELVKDCIAFANATGGRLLLGIEDGQAAPPADQRIPADLPDTIRRRIVERSVNVAVLPDVVTAANGGQYINLAIPRAVAVASTTDGRYYLRVADQSKPVTGDDVLRLAAERAALPWETQTTLQVPRSASAPEKLGKLVHALRASDRVKPSVKEKSDDQVRDKPRPSGRGRIARAA